MTMTKQATIAPVTSSLQRRRDIAKSALDFIFLQTRTPEEVHAVIQLLAEAHEITTISAEPESEIINLN